MPEQMKNLLIGIFVALAMCLVVAMVLFIKPTVGDGKQILHVRFSNINGISVGTRVIFAGRAIGEVKSIDVSPDARRALSDGNGSLYYYNLTLKIDSHIPVYDIDEFTTQTSGLLGDKSVAIIPKAPKEGQTPKLLNAQSTIYAESSDLLESAYSLLSNLSKKVESTFDSITAWIKNNGDQLGDAVLNFDNMVKEAHVMLKDVNQQNLIIDFKEATDSFTSTMDSINQAITTLDETDTFNNVSCLVETLKDTTSKIGKVVDKVADGEGTVGKLFNDDDTYLQINSVLSKFNTMMNDINQYGVLFNMNKQWQRSRVKQASMIKSLESPIQFKNYFEQEIDQINTAMGRISLLIEKASERSNREAIMRNPLFKSEFKDLMQQVDTLKDSLKLYNQYLNEVTGEAKN